MENYEEMKIPDLSISYRKSCKDREATIRNWTTEQQLVPSRGRDIDKDAIVFIMVTPVKYISIPNWMKHGWNQFAGRISITSECADDCTATYGRRECIERGGSEKLLAQHCRS